MCGVQWYQTWHMHTSCTHIEHTLHTSCAHLEHILRTSCTNLAHIFRTNCTHLAHILHTSCTHLAHILHTSCTHLAPIFILHTYFTQFVHILHTAHILPYYQYYFLLFTIIRIWGSVPSSWWRHLFSWSMFYWLNSSTVTVFVISQLHLTEVIKWPKFSSSPNKFQIASWNIPKCLGSIKNC